MICLFRFGLSGLFAVGHPAAALAEICGLGAGHDSWSAAHGPVWLFNPIGWPLGLIGLTGWLIFAARGPRWAGYAGAALLAAWIGASLLDVVPQHEVYLVQVREGCRSPATDWADIGLLTVFAIAYGLLGFRRHLTEARRDRVRTDI